MPEHRGSRRIRNTLIPMAVMLAVVSIVVGVQGTGAYWTDTAEVDAGTLGSGSLELKLRPSNNAADPFTDSVTVPAAALSGMLPGDSRAFSLAVRSDGIDAPMTYQLLGQSSGAAVANGNVLGNALQTQIWVTGADAANPGGPTTGYRTDQFGSSYGASCPSGPQIGLQTTLSVSSPVLLTDSATNPAPVLTPGGVSNLCIRLALPNGVAGTAMGKSTTVTFTVVGRSVER